MYLLRKGKEMSHNPNTVKSQDDTTEDELGRTMTLLRAIEQLEKTECKLEKVEKQLAIAVEALDSLRGICFPERAEKALKEIEELDNGR